MGRAQPKYCNTCGKTVSGANASRHNNDSHEGQAQMISIGSYEYKPVRGRPRKAP